MLSNPRFGQLFRSSLALASLATCCALPVRAEDTLLVAAPIMQPVITKVTAGNTRIDLTVNTSRILETEQKIPKVQVGNPDLLDFTALSENQVQIHGKKPGITSINLWDEDGEIHSVDVVVVGDVRELDMVLKQQFPTATIKLFPTAASTLILFGYVDNPNNVSRITDIAREYFPKVLNNMTVGGSQQVLLHVRVMEISRTKLRNLGFDWMNFSGSNYYGTVPGGGITKASATTGLFRGGGDFTTAGRETVQVGIISNPSGFVGMLEVLKQENLLKVLAEPNIVTVSGRPAYFQIGGLVPYPQPTGFGNISVAFRPFGTQVDFVPIVLGNGNVRLEVKPAVSEIDPTLTLSVAGTTVPGFRSREVDTGVEMKFGQTLALAGLLQQRTTALRQGVPYLMDIPYLGAAFRRTSNQVNEVELLIMVRPELAEGLDQVPPCGPGMNSMSPDDCDLYWKGHIEVPVGPAGMLGPGPSQMPGGVYPGGGAYPAGVGPNGPVVPGPGPGGPPAGDIGPGEPLAPPQPPVPIEPSARNPRTSSAAAEQSEGPSERIASSAPIRPRLEQPNSVASEPYNPSNSQSRKSQTPAKSTSLQPGFIGPRGYDVKE